MQEPKSVLIFISVIAGLIFNITYVMMMGKIVHVESNFASALTGLWKHCVQVCKECRVDFLFSTVLYKYFNKTCIQVHPWLI